jgi:hypothetical protein
MPVKPGEYKVFVLFRKGKLVTSRPDDALKGDLTKMLTVIHPFRGDWREILKHVDAEKEETLVPFRLIPEKDV